MTDKQVPGPSLSAEAGSSGSVRASSAQSAPGQPTLFNAKSGETRDGKPAGKSADQKSDNAPDKPPGKDGFSRGKTHSSSQPRRNKTEVPKLPIAESNALPTPEPPQHEIHPPGAHRTTPQYPCICPGEKYPITRSVCLGRQSRNFERCRHCKFHLEDRIFPKKDYRGR